MGSRLERMGVMRDRVINAVTGYKLQIREPRPEIPLVRPYVCGYIQEMQEQASLRLSPKQSTSTDTSPNQLEELTMLMITEELFPYMQRAQQAYEDHQPFMPSTNGLRLALTVEEAVRIRKWVIEKSSTSGQKPHIILPVSPNKKVSPQRVLYQSITLIGAALEIPTDTRLLGLMLRGSL